jgi:hypothetical protein
MEINQAKQITLGLQRMPSGPAEARKRYALRVLAMRWRNA